MFLPVPGAILNETRERRNKNLNILCACCVYVNTSYRRDFVNVASREWCSKEFGRRAGEKMAHKKRLVAGSPRRKTSTARLEHKQGFAGKFRSEEHTSEL